MSFAGHVVKLLLCIPSAIAMGIAMVWWAPVAIGVGAFGFLPLVFRPERSYETNWGTLIAPWAFDIIGLFAINAAFGTEWAVGATVILVVAFMAEIGGN